MATAATSTSAATTTTSTTGPGTGATGAGSLIVMPRVGSPGTTFRFSFMPRLASGRRGSFQISYILGASGPTGAGCQGQRSAPVRSAAPGHMVTVVLGPSSGGARWCPGPYRAAVSEVEGPYCRPRTMCPQFVRLVGIVARGTFRVRRA